jgi:tRNA-dihydrouridine synthase A
MDVLSAALSAAAYQNPWMLAAADALIFNDTAAPPDPKAVFDAMLPYVERRLSDGVPLQAITRHLHGLFRGRPGAKAWRRHLSEAAHRVGAGIEVLVQAAKQVS